MTLHWHSLPGSSPSISPDGHSGWLPLTPFKASLECWSLLVLFSVSVARLSVVFFLVLPSSLVNCCSLSPLHRPPWTPANFPWYLLDGECEARRGFLDWLCFLSQTERRALDIPSEPLDPSSPVSLYGRFLLLRYYSVAASVGLIFEYKVSSLKDFFIFIFLFWA